MAIVNLKKEAREIFQCLERLDVNHEFELIHLSTAMCGRHRTDCLNRIGALLDPGNPKPVICVSTQLIEAGVDISFACVVRAMAGLDSIMQAAGRCNRNGESVEPKNVYVYPLKDEDSMERYLPDIAMGKQLTLQIMENYPGKDLLSSNILEQYYDMLLRKKDGNTNSTILLCSATQPLLEKTKRENLLLSEKPDLIAETESYEDKLRRTRITMYLEPNRDDRDYLYGRLLALADNFEESVLRKQGVKDRPTNAIKLMSNFTAKPYTTWGTLWKQLMPYLKSANGGSWFRNEVDDVMALFKEGDFEDNSIYGTENFLWYAINQ